MAAGGQALCVMEKDIWSLSVGVIGAAMGHTDGKFFPDKCNELYDYFYNNLDKIVRKDKLGYHVGSAFYFMGTSMKDKESDRYKFSMLVSFINLYRALPDGDMQACIAAHRLFLLLALDGRMRLSFFDLRIMSQSCDLDEMLNPCPENHFEKLTKFKNLAYNFLAQYLVGEGAVALQLLNAKEQELFKREFEKIYGVMEQDSHKRLDAIRKGEMVLNLIHDELIDEIDCLRSLGVIA